MVSLTLSTCGGATPSTTNPPASVEPTGSSSAPPSISASPESPAPARIELPVEPGSTVEGLVAVDGHDIYARCTGEGAPTVVYFTGWADDLGKRGVAIAHGIESALGETIRTCSYERRNTGRSEAVGGTQSPEDVKSHPPFGG